MENEQYEYDTVYLVDSENGFLEQRRLNDELSVHAKDGWRLHTMTVKEVGKNSHTARIFDFEEDTKEPIELVILVFERRVII